VRSPSFTIENKHILFRVGGRGMTINLIIDGFQQIRDPIYGGLTFGVNNGDEPRWHVMNVSMWQGHRAYIECLDNNEGYLVLDRVLFSDGSPPPEAPNAALLKLLDEDLNNARSSRANCAVCSMKSLASGARASSTSWLTENRERTSSIICW